MIRIPSRLSIFCALLLCLSVGGCSSLYFYPRGGAYPWTPAAGGITFESAQIPVTEHTSLASWLLSSPLRPVSTVVVFFHGNAMNMAYHLGSVVWLLEHGYDVLTIDYRGFGESSGNPTIEGAVTDGAATIEYVSTTLKARYPHVILFGQSIGASLTPIALKQAQAKDSVRGIILDSGFSDFRGIARDTMDQFLLFRPFSFVLSMLFPTTPSPCEALRSLSVPLLILHARDDTVVPRQHSEQLAACAQGQKRRTYQRGDKSTGES